MPTTLMLIVVSSGLLVQPSEPPAPATVPPNVAKFLAQCETSRRGAIVQLEFDLRGLRAQSVSAPQTARKIAELEQELRALKASQKLVVPSLQFPPEVGAIGRLPGLSCHVEQVVSERELLIRCYFPVTIRTVRRSEAYLETIERPLMLLLRGIPTAKIHAGADIELPQVFEIATRHTYRTEGGTSRSVLVLEQFDLGTVMPALKSAGEGRVSKLRNSDG